MATMILPDSSTAFSAPSYLLFLSPTLQEFLLLRFWLACFDFRDLRSGRNFPRYHHRFVAHGH